VDLFTLQVPSESLHPIFAMLLNDRYSVERAVLSEWATGMVDRDQKFVQEFQTTFDSCFWELYLNAAVSAWNLQTDYSFASPDFVITAPTSLCIEAAVASSEQGMYGSSRSVHLPAPPA
jgi:hypothetical protein